MQKTTTDNLHMDRQCKKKQQTIYIWTDSAKNNNRQFTYGQTVQKKLHWSIYSAPDSAKKKQQTIYIWTDSAKNNNRQFTYGQTVQKKQQTIYIWTDSAKNNNRQFTYGQTVQKKLHWSIYSAPDSAKKHNNSNLHMDRQCKKTTAIYIWTVHIYSLQSIQSNCLWNINVMSGLSFLKVTDLVYDLQVLGFKCRKPEMDSADPDSDSNCCKFPWKRNS